MSVPADFAATLELAIPKLRSGSYFPSFLEHRRRAERALARSWRRTPQEVHDEFLNRQLAA